MTGESCGACAEGVCDSAPGGGPTGTGGSPVGSGTGGVTTLGGPEGGGIPVGTGEGISGPG